MPYDKRTYLYEILLRFGKDGLAGSHVIDIEEVYDTENGDILSAKELPARPITADEVGQYLGKANAEAVERLAAAQQSLDDDRKAHEAECTALDHRKSELAGLASAIVKDYARPQKREAPK